MKLILLFFVFQPLQSAISPVCHQDFDETLCDNFKFSPDLFLSSATNKLSIKNATGRIIHENFAKFNQVTEIQIRNSTVEGIEPEALCCVPKLTSITLAENGKFPKITRRVLQGCQHIKRLHFDGNEIQIEKGAFKELDSLQSLTLNATLMSKDLERNFFVGLKIVNSLTIRHTQCATIKESAFTDLKQLKFLDLQSNQIETIEPGSFKSLVQLKVLNLSDNKLKILTWDEFNGLSSLRVLFLERNSFDSIDVDKLLRSVPNLERIFLSYDKLKPESRKMVEDVFPKLNITFIYVGKPIN